MKIKCWWMRALWLEGAVSHFAVRTHREPTFNPILCSHGPGEPHDTREDPSWRSQS